MINMYLACPNCKYVNSEWTDSNIHNRIVRTIKEIGMSCPRCFASMKIITGKMPETCHHGTSVTTTCKKCKEGYD